MFEGNQAGCENMILYKSWKDLYQISSNFLHMKYFSIYYMISCANQEKRNTKELFVFSKEKGMCSILRIIVYKVFHFHFFVVFFLRQWLMFCMRNGNKSKKTLHVHHVQTFITVDKP